MAPITHATLFPFDMLPMNNISAPTYRDGVTYTRGLEQLKVWINTVLVPEFNAGIDNAFEQFAAGIENIENRIIESEAAYDALINDALASVAASVVDLTAYVDGETLAARDYVDAAIQFINNKTGQAQIQRATLTGPHTVTIDPLWPNNHPIHIVLTQDGTGGHPVTLGAGIVGAVDLDTAPGAVTSFDLYPAGDDTWFVVQRDNTLPGEYPDALTAALISRVGSQTIAALKDKFLTGLPLAGPGIDPTGVAVSTAAVQARIDSAAAFGADVHIPADAIIKLDGMITIGSRLTLSGPGTLTWSAGIVNNAAIQVNADGTKIDGVRLLNPSELGANSGSRSIAIEIRANNVTVTNTFIELFQNGIVVNAAGEYYNTIITHNRVKDVIGAGGGPTGTDGLGEDRGDAILSWGAMATVANNIVNAKAGTDARIGIHVEGLSTFGDPLLSPHPNAMAAITGNIVYGPFRRGIVNESVKHVAITGNIVADATWWGIAVIYGADRSTVTGNVVLHTRAAGQNQGSAWTPLRAGMMLYGNVHGSTVTGNTIYAPIGAEMPNGIVVQAVATGSQCEDTIIAHNTIIDQNETMVIGIRFENYGGRRNTVKDNTIRGFTGTGVYGYRAEDITIDANKIFGGTVPANRAIRLESSTTPATIRNNKIDACTNGIQALSRAGSLIITGNDIRNATTGVDAFGILSTDAVLIRDNLFTNVTTDYANYQYGKRRVSLSWDVPELASAAGVTSPDITYPGAGTGDMFAVTSSSNPAGYNAFAYCPSAGIVRIRLANTTATTFAGRTMTWSVMQIGK